jgi:hypothetical protein
VRIVSRHLLRKIEFATRTNILDAGVMTKTIETYLLGEVFSVLCTVEGKTRDRQTADKRQSSVLIAVEVESAHENILLQFSCTSDYIKTNADG